MVSYHSTSFQLLFWLRLGGKGHINTLNEVGFSIVVTSYLEKDAPDLTNYRACADGSRFIRRNFFCDGRRNCALDPLSEEADESEQSCGSSLLDQLIPSSPPLSTPHLNLLTVTLVLVSAAVLLLALLVLAVRLRRHHSCFHPSSPSPRQPELPDRAGMARPGATRPHTLLQSTRVTENLMQQPPPPPVESHNVRSGGTPDSDSEPPPAYCDLFPVGYTFEEEKTEAMIEPQNLKITSRPFAEESTCQGEGSSTVGDIQEMTTVESEQHGEDIHLAEQCRTTALPSSNME